jgi:hypothetical protein
MLAPTNRYRGSVLAELLQAEAHEARARRGGRTAVTWPENRTNPRKHVMTRGW